MALTDGQRRAILERARGWVRTLAAILELARERPFELQRLHGMGEALNELVLDECRGRLACRTYDPVGSHQDLLPYLVRRLRENGANSSFVNRITDAQAPVKQVVTDPVDRVRVTGGAPAPRIPNPRDLFRPDRANSAGLDLSDPDALAELSRTIDQAIQIDWAAPLDCRPGARDARGGHGGAPVRRPLGLGH